MVFEKMQIIAISVIISKIVIFVFVRTILKTANISTGVLNQRVVLTVSMWRSVNIVMSVLAVRRALLANTVLIVAKGVIFCFVLIAVAVMIVLVVRISEINRIIFSTKNLHQMLTRKD